MNKMSSFIDKKKEQGRRGWCLDPALVFLARIDREEAWHLGAWVGFAQNEGATEFVHLAVEVEEQDLVSPAFCIAHVPDEPATIGGEAIGGASNIHGLPRFTVADDEACRWLTLII